MALSSIADRVTRWKNLADAMRTHAEEIPNLKEEQATLAQEVAGIEALMVEEDGLSSQLREATQRRKAAEKRCVELVGRISTGLQSIFGKRSPKLRKYDVPILTSGRKKKEEKPTPVPPAAAAAS